MKLILVLALFAVCQVNCDLTDWNEFKATFKKSYVTLKEEEDR